MGSRGPKPAPTQLKVVRGDQESRINRDEPLPSDRGGIDPPAGTSDGALEVWYYLAPDLIDKGCLTSWDVYTFAVFCEAVNAYRENKALMGSMYTAKGAAGGVIKSPHWQIMRDAADVMAKYSSRFGLTPGDRADLRVGGDDSMPKGGAERILG
jgi:P27 family predicted phage terminase small subunit